LSDLLARRIAAPESEQKAWRTKHGIILEQHVAKSSTSPSPVVDGGDVDGAVDGATAGASGGSDSVAALAAETADATGEGNYVSVTTEAPNVEEEEEDGVFDDVDLSSNEPTAPAPPPPSITAAAAVAAASFSPTAVDAAAAAAAVDSPVHEGQQQEQQQQQQQQLSSKLGRLSKAKSLPYRSPQTGAKIEGGFDVATTHVADILLHYMPFFMM